MQRTAYLEARVEQLEGQLGEAEGLTQRRLRALRQQHDRVAAGYDSRVASLQEKLGQKGKLD